MQPAILYAIETVPGASSQEKEIEVLNMNMCGFTRMDQVMNDDIMDRVEVEAISARCKKIGSVGINMWKVRNSKCVQTHTADDAIRKEKEKKKEKGRNAKTEIDEAHQKWYENDWYNIERCQLQLKLKKGHSELLCNRDSTPIQEIKM